MLIAGYSQISQRPTPPSIGARIAADHPSAYHLGSARPTIARTHISSAFSRWPHRACGFTPTPASPSLTELPRLEAGRRVPRQSRRGKVNERLRFWVLGFSELLVLVGHGGHSWYRGRIFGFPFRTTGFLPAAPAAGPAKVISAWLTVGEQTVIGCHQWQASLARRLLPAVGTIRGSNFSPAIDFEANGTGLKAN